jgi:hypothetical protein
MDNPFVTLLEYAQVYFNFHRGESYEVLPFHHEIEEKLNAVVLGDLQNLIICMPPRFGKSELAIRIFVSWSLSFAHDANFIVAANTLDLARAHVKAIRDILSSDWYQELFPNHPTLRESNNRKSAKVQKSLARSDFFETIQGGAVNWIGRVNHRFWSRKKKRLFRRLHNLRRSPQGAGFSFAHPKKHCLRLV